MKTNISSINGGGIILKNKIIKVENISIGISQVNKEDYICITDMAGAKENNTRVSEVIKNWLRR